MTMLKQLTVVMSFLLFSFTINAQDYYIDYQNLTWKESYAPVPTRQMYKVFTEGDSIINGKEYDLLFRQFICEYIPFPNPDVKCSVRPPSLYAGMRQDSGKVYAYEFDSGSDYYNQEYLLMDFNLSEGDTMYITDDKKFFIRVNEITYTGNGTKMMTTNLSNWFFSDSPYGMWIQGIGSTISLKYFIGPPHWSSNCYRYNEEPIVGFEDLGWAGCPCDHCLDEFTSTDEVANEELYLFPNPTTKEIEIKGISKNKIIDYQIVDIRGNSYSAIISSADNANFDVSNLEPQLYFFKLHLNNNRTKTLKFIKY